MFTFTARGNAVTQSNRIEEWKSLRVCVSAASWLVIAWLSHASAQVLIDRVLARVDGAPLTLTDVETAIGLGVVQGPIDAGMQQMINRYLELGEVQRFPPPEPPPAAVAAEAARLKMNAGSRLQALMQSTGLTDQRILDIARDNRRIASYLEQRFGTTVQVSDEEVADYYRAHEAEFTRSGEALPFEEAEAVARQRASDERRRAIIDRWLADLRNRADVVVNQRQEPPAPIR
jgi:hypothetical protein